MYNQNISLCKVGNLYTDASLKAIVLIPMNGLCFSKHHFQGPAIYDVTQSRSCLRLKSSPQTSLLCLKCELIRCLFVL